MDFNKQLMHKKLEKDLISLAHDILKMKNRDDIFALKEKSRDVFERISMLAFIEEYVNTTPNLETTKEDLIETVEKAFELKEVKLEEKNVFVSDEFVQVQETSVNEIIEETPTISSIEEPEISISEPILEQPFDELEQIMFAEKTIEDNIEIEINQTEERKVPTLEDELLDTISVDIMADLFENVQPKSLNDRLVNSIQIGLNDRIAFVKNLFNGEQEDFNRVISQLNSYETEKEAKNFIEKVVKPDYNWAEHEELENRFLEIVSRKFA
ncbi:hypothetical protein [Polaribacter sp.]|uniref:hypothetical protein n=1 Tax=Polaribacter sp. TaxID=1920175 RepID=UPI0040472B87